MADPAVETNGFGTDLSENCGRRTRRRAGALVAGVTRVPGKYDQLLMVGWLRWRLFVNGPRTVTGKLNPAVQIIISAGMGLGMVGYGASSVRGRCGSGLILPLAPGGKLGLVRNWLPGACRHHTWVAYRRVPNLVSGVAWKRREALMAELSRSD
jgi:hypothetical protein